MLIFDDNQGSEGFCQVFLQLSTKKYMKMTPAAEGRQACFIFISFSSHVEFQRRRRGGGAVASHFAARVSGLIDKQPAP